MTGTFTRSHPDCECPETNAPEQACPYDEDINNDPTPTCNCCAACTRMCAEEI